MSSPVTPDKIRAALPRASKSFLRLNGVDISVSAKVIRPDQPKIRSPQKRRSKLQAEFFEWLEKSSSEKTVVLEERITFELAAGCRYTPDFLVYEPPRETKTESRAPFLVAYEVKGPRAWEDSIVKLKVAARAYPWIQFYLVTRNWCERSHFSKTLIAS